MRLEIFTGGVLMIPRTRYKMLLVLAAAISSRATSISTPEVIPPPAVAVHAGIHDLNTFGQTVLDLGPTGYAANRDALSDAAAWINQQRIVVGGQSTVEKNPNGTISAAGCSEKTCPSHNVFL